MRILQVVGCCATLAIALVLASIVADGAMAAADQPLILALTPSRDPTALQEAGDEFAKTITRMSGVPIRAQVASDYAGVVEALRSRRVDLAFVHPVGLRAGQPRSRMPDPRARHLAGKDGVHRALLRRKGSRDRAAGGPARQDHRLRGSRVELRLHLSHGLADQEGPGAGSRPEDLLQGGAVRRDARGGAAVGPARPGRRGGVVRQGARGPPEGSRARRSARPSSARRRRFPRPASARARDFRAETLARLKQALLAIKGPEHAAVLKQIYDIDGFVEASDRDYEPVRDAMKLMELGPPK